MTFTPSRVTQVEQHPTEDEHAAGPQGDDPETHPRGQRQAVQVNGCRYNVPGGWAEVCTATRDGQAIVSVRNTGQEIPPAELSSLFLPFQFLPFQRLGAERAYRHTGHGLGLAIVRAIADAHGASLTATARQGGGLDIAVSFPG